MVEEEVAAGVTAAEVAAAEAAEVSHRTLHRFQVRISNVYAINTKIMKSKKSQI